jgi:hypothetical protein
MVHLTKARKLQQVKGRVIPLVAVLTLLGNLLGSLGGR